MIKITQCLCPSRHCTLAIAWDSKGATNEEMESYLKQVITGLEKQGRINPWCDLCGSRTFSYETGETKFTTIAEATPALKATEAANMAANALHHQAKNN